MMHVTSIRDELAYDVANVWVILDH